MFITDENVGLAKVSHECAVGKCLKALSSYVIIGITTLGKLRIKFYESNGRKFS